LGEEKSTFGFVALTPKGANKRKEKKGVRWHLFKKEK
jgi:hypothetical protein